MKQGTVNLNNARVGLCLMLWLTVLVFCVGCVTPSSADDVAQFDSAVPKSWYALSLKLVRETDGFSPPVASRAWGYFGLTLYEALQPGMEGYQSLVGQLNELEQLPTPNARHLHWPTVANTALAYALRKQAPLASAANLQAIDALERDWNDTFRPMIGTARFNRSVVWGQTIAEAIYQYSLTDHGHRGYLMNFPLYTMPQGEGLWVPTPPRYERSLQPFWGENRPFVLANNNPCKAPPPLPYSEAIISTFYQQAFEVYDTINNLTPEQREIAEFWADDPKKTATPAGHWIQIVGEVLPEETPLSQSAELYARLGLGMADAFISCWQTKYTYNLIRPVSYIQKVIDPQWNRSGFDTPVLTPPFPEYTSGHSVVSGAAYTILSAMIGENVPFTDTYHDLRNLPLRSFLSFRQAAEEAAISRLYGGVHYRFTVERGLQQGECIGQQMLNLRFRP